MPSCFNGLKLEPMSGTTLCLRNSPWENPLGVYAYSPNRHRLTETSTAHTILDFGDVSETIIAHPPRIEA